jgi:uncharacterized pyridoxamine 5'-phosphate oxidase family protein
METEIISFFKENPVCAFSTVDNGKPSVRPIMLMFESGGKLYFGTANTKQMYKHMKNNPNIELSTSSKDYSTTLRISGKVTFSDDPLLKQRVINENEQVRAIYKTAENPIFEIFFIEHGTARLQYFTGLPEKTIEF